MLVMWVEASKDMDLFYANNILSGLNFLCLHVHKWIVKSSTAVACLCPNCQNINKHVVWQETMKRAMQSVNRIDK